MAKLTLRTAFCQSFLTKTTQLNAAQAQAVINAYTQSDEIDFRILTKEIGGRKRTVVVMSENHLARASDAPLNGAVVDEFRSIGVEGGNPYAESQDNGFDFWAFTGTFLASVLGYPRTIVDIPRMVMGERSFANTPTAMAPHGDQVERVVNAEDGHRWRPSEAGALMGLRGLSSLSVAHYYGAFFAAVSIPSGSFAAGAIALGVTLGMKAGAHLLTQRLNRVPVQHFELARHRDSIIAQNTQAFFTEYPDEDVYLVVLGTNHLPGVEINLVRDHGFTSVFAGEG